MRILLAVFFVAIAGDLCQAQVKRSRPMPKVETIGEGVVWRVSDNKDLHGNAVPPWKEVQVRNVFGFKRAPNIGEKVTIIPLDAHAGVIHLSIRKTQKRTQCDDSDGETWWELDLEPVSQKEYFEISSMPNRRDEVPFDVAIIYPAVKRARQLRRNELKQTMLPLRIALNTVKGAIDLTNDGIPDVMLVEYCCGQPKKPATHCDLTCGKTFRKVRDTWKLIDTSGPC